MSKDCFRTCLVGACLVVLLSVCASEDFVSATKWIMADELTDEGLDKDRYFRSAINIREGLVRATCEWWFDDQGDLVIDGRRQGGSVGKMVDVTDAISDAGRHVFAVRNRNLAGKGGVCLAVRMEYSDGNIMYFHTDDTWKASRNEITGWDRPDFDDSGWERVRILGDALCAPWSGYRDMAVFLTDSEREAVRRGREEKDRRRKSTLERLKKERKPTCKVVYDRGRSRFDIGGRLFETTFYNVSQHIWREDERDLIRQTSYFRDAGIHLYGVGVDTAKIWKEDGYIDVAAAIAPMATVLTIDPEARFLFCISQVMPPRWWVDRYREELVGYANGTINFEEIACLKNPAVPSFASLLWRRDVCDYMRRLVAYIESTPYANRIFAYRPDFGINHEWHYYGMRGLMPDCGSAMTAAFRRWLRRNYNGDVSALRSAWRNPQVSFNTAMTPSIESRLRTSAGRGLRDPVQDCQVVDYERCHAEQIRECLHEFNRSVKEACGYRALVGNYCGYFFGLPEAAEGCHLENDAILDSSLVDFQCSPFNYDRNGRKLGGPQSPRCLLEGLRRRGKVALMEADNSTSIADTRYCKYSKTIEEDIAILSRDFASTLCWGCGFWYFDFGNGWYAHPAYKEFFRKIFPIRARDADCSSVSEVLMVGDYESMMFSNIRMNCEMHTKLATIQVYEMMSAGIPCDFASFNDLASGKLKDYKVYFFPNLLYRTPEKERVIGQLLAAGKSVLCTGEAGFLTPSGVDSKENILTMLRKEAPLKASFWREFCREKGVHVWNEDADTSIYANAGYVAIHTASAGKRTVNLPKTKKVIELFPGNQVLGDCLSNIVINAPGPSTFIFAIE